MSDAALVLVFAAALGSGLMAGIFFVFSNFVMAGLARVPAATGIASMQQINLTVINPLFMVAFMGTGLVSLAADAAVLLDWDGSYGPYVLAGSALYLVGSIGLTMGYHQPRNLALGELDAGSAEASRYWAVYLREWIGLNHVRTVFSLIAAGLMIGAIHVG